MPVIELTHDMGSSPRIRGKSLEPSVPLSRHGLIPAHTGKMFGNGAEGGMIWAHPRAYGENDEPVFVYLAGVGSSPRIRGK